MNKKVVLAMSGGVDSSVAALLLKKQGYQVHGFFMNCNQKSARKWPSAINWEEEEKYIREICFKLGIDDLFILDCEEGYERKIISKMFRDYFRGLTPNPDILCNNIGKIPGLLKRAKAIGAEFIATGHYARVRRGLMGFELLEAKDKEKDQSYFLCGIGQKYLRRLIFPVGDLTKEEVREIALKEGFSNWNKRGSRGICYLGKIDMKRFLHERIKEKQGEVLSSSGEVIGSHPGSFYFTIGERVKERDGVLLNRKKVDARAKYYVAKKLSGNRIVVAIESDEILKTCEVFIKGFKSVNPSEKLPLRLKARVRHLGEKYSGRLLKKDGRWKFVFSRGVFGVAPGQFIVFYDSEKLVAGGEIRLNSLK